MVVCYKKNYHVKKTADNTEIYKTSGTINIDLSAMATNSLFGLSNMMAVLLNQACSSLTQSGMQKPQPNTEPYIRAEQSSALPRSWRASGNPGHALLNT